MEYQYLISRRRMISYETAVSENWHRHCSINGSNWQNKAMLSTILCVLAHQLRGWLTLAGVGYHNTGKYLMWYSVISCPLEMKLHIAVVAECKTTSKKTTAGRTSSKLSGSSQGPNCNKTQFQRPIHRPLHLNSTKHATNRWPQLSVIPCFNSSDWIG